MPVDYTGHMITRGTDLELVKLITPLLYLDMSNTAKDLLLNFEINNF